MVLISCGTSTGSRYEKVEEKNVDEKETKEEIKEDFDITPYKTKIIINESPENKNGYTEAWYEYNQDVGTNNISSTHKIIGTTDGFRVLVLITDDLNEANSLMDEVKSKISNNEVYVSFEPPFYKIKVGDFIDITECNNLKFKLNQLGYTEARVIKETINLFEE